MNTQKTTPSAPRSPKRSIAASVDIQEEEAASISGWFAVIGFLVFAYFIVMQSTDTFNLIEARNSNFIWGAIKIPVMVITFMVLVRGFKIIQPGDSIVTTFFGKYDGSVREPGFHYLNPLASYVSVSLKINNLTTPTIKVNDATGNPIEVGATIAWEIQDTAKAAFAVSNYATYISTQSDSALRQVAASHPYDNENSAKSLRGNMQGVAQELVAAIEASVVPAGIRVVDARIAHLAYAPEIASSMLARQQADQVISAREKIVHGAVGMVKSVLDELKAKEIVSMDEHEKAALVTNLMTVLVSHNDAQPVIPMASASSSSKDRG